MSAVNLALQDALDEFLTAVQADGLSKATYRWYRSILTAFVKQYPAVGLTDVQARTIREYINGLRETDYSAETVDTHIRALHRFWNWSSREFHINNPMENIRFPSPKEKKPRAVELEDIRKMWTVASTRDKFILLWLLDTGCRAAGLCNMKLSDVDLANQRAIVTEKGNKSRAVRFTTITAEWLRRYLDERPLSPNQNVILNHYHGTPLTTSGLYQALRYLARRAKVDRRFNPHGFRHRFSIEYIKRGGDLATLSILLGHRDVTTTVRHYIAFTDDELRGKHERFSPVSEIVKVREK